MRSHPAILIVSVLLLSAAWLTSCGSSSGEPTTSTARSNAAATAAGAKPGSSLLFVQDISSGSITETSPGRYRLSLKQPRRFITTFTDRPARLTSRETLKSFLSSWKERGFISDPPNAALAIDDAPESADLFLLTISSPKLSSDGSRLDFDATPLSGDAPALARFAEGRDTTSARQFGAASLFIDDAPGGAPIRMTFIARNIQPGQNVTVRLTAGATFVIEQGLHITSSTGESMPLQGIHVLPNTLTITTAPDSGNSGSALAWTTSTDLLTTGDLIQLSAQADPGVVVTAGMVGHQSVTLSSESILIDPTG